MGTPGPKGSNPGECPICGKPAEEGFRPFCSRRCANVDLGRWLDGAYTIPGEPVPDTGAPAKGDEEGE